LITVKEIEYNDIDKGFLEVLDNLVSTNIDNEFAKEILMEIKSNPLHRIFVAKDDEHDIVVGTTTLLIEPKFINKGMRVGYIEDVSVRKGYERLGIGRQIIDYATNNARDVYKCQKVLLYCSEQNKTFYEKLGYRLTSNTCVMKIEFLST
jgi:glucosamine-phosphate N-acetyltransferase